MSNVRVYFDTNSHSHVYHNDPKIYYSIIKQVLKENRKEYYNILDVGCGDGAFLKGLASYGIKGSYFGTDLSFNMLKQMSKENYENLMYFASDIFELPIKENVKFDLIHIDSVMHHLIKKNRRESKELTISLLKILAERLSKDGILVVEEKYYDSYLFKNFTAGLIFYGLKLFNFLNIDISKLIKEFALGLEVNFFHEDDLVEMLQTHGSVSMIGRRKVKVPFPYRMILLRDYGHVSYTVVKAST